MKYNGIFLLCFTIGCSSDLEINSGHPSVPVVYSIINPYDTVHYVRVQKTFIINKKEDWATLNPDSLQFRDVDVFLYGKAGDSINWAEQFSETTIIKDEGFFPDGNYQAFILNHRLPIVLSKPDRYYYGTPDIDSLILEVRIHDIDVITRACVKVLLPSKIYNYKSRYVLYLYGSYPSVYAISPPGEENSGSLLYQQIDFRVHYKDYYKNTSAIKEVSWMANTGWDGTAYFMSPTRFFNPLKVLLPKNDSIISRRLDSIDIALLRPSNFFNFYWTVQKYWEDSDRPPYTNFDNSYGMFFTITRDAWTGLTLNWDAMDSLCSGFFNKEMKFRKY